MSHVAYKCVISVTNWCDALYWKSIQFFGSFKALTGLHHVTYKWVMSLTKWCDKWVMSLTNFCDALYFPHSQFVRQTMRHPSHKPENWGKCTRHRTQHTRTPSHKLLQCLVYFPHLPVRERDGAPSLSRTRETWQVHPTPFSRVWAMGWLRLVGSLKV